MRILETGLYGLSPTRYNSGLPKVRQVQTGGASPTLQVPPRTGNILLLFGASIQQGDFTTSGAGATWTRIGRVTQSGGGGGAQLETQAWVGKVGSSPTQSITAAWVNQASSWVFELDATGIDGSVISTSTGSANVNSITLATLFGLGIERSHKTVLFVYMWAARGTTNISVSKRTSFTYMMETANQSGSPKTGLGFTYFRPGISMPGLMFTAGNNLSSAIAGVIR